MSGFRRSLVRLVFSDPEYTGLLVVCKRPSIGMIIALSDARDRAAGTSIASMLDPILVDFAGLIAEWNLEEHDGTPVPVTAGGLRTQDPALVLAIVTALMEVASVTAPLGPRSSDGDPSLEESMPMETSSGNPES